MKIGVKTYRSMLAWKPNYLFIKHKVINLKRTEERVPGDSFPPEASHSHIVQEISLAPDLSRITVSLPCIVYMHFHY